LFLIFSFSVFFRLITTGAGSAKQLSETSQKNRSGNSKEAQGETKIEEKSWGEQQDRVSSNAG
jgi:hypothetical protein